MSYQFCKHYTREEARALLPKIRRWLDQIQGLRGDMEKLDKRINGAMCGGNDVGGTSVNESLKKLATLKDVITEFEARGILIKDVNRGLVDFPAIMGDKEVFLCWEIGEEDVEHWHELDAGYSGREPL
jgi:hypothetical protein